MSQPHTTPQDAEDAYYDALEDGDLDRLMAVWDDSDEISCLLPMQALVQGRAAVRAAFEPLIGFLPLDQTLRSQFTMMVQQQS